MVANFLTGIGGYEKSGPALTFPLRPEPLARRQWSLIRQDDRLSSSVAPNDLLALGLLTPTGRELRLD